MHATGNVISAKLMMLPGTEEESRNKINEKLPNDISIIKIIRVTRGFNAKNNCTSRIYEYLLPKSVVTEESDDSRIRESVEKLNGILSSFEGTKCFQNYTDGLMPGDKT